MPPPYRAALVTGASSGIGRAIAIALRGAGMNVFALGRDAEALAALEAQCGAAPVVGDVRDGRDAVGARDRRAHRPPARKTGAGRASAPIWWDVTTAS